MRLALWDLPSADLYARGAETADVPVDVVRAPMLEAEALLRQGQVDVALVPTLRVLTDRDAFDVLPAVALSSWAHPYARLVFRGELDRPVQHVSFDARYAQEVTLTRIILKEHYGATPSFVPLQKPSLDELLVREEDATLIVGPEVPKVESRHYVMDIGQEWYELSAYPMLWGLFVTRREEGTAEAVHQLREVAAAAEQAAPAWLEAQALEPDIDAYFRDALRLRFDDLATASLTAFREYLFYYDIVDEVAELHMVEVEGEEDSGDDPSVSGRTLQL